MKMLFRFASAVLWLACACGAPGRPSGLPPPEYVQPTVEPYSPPIPAPATAGPAEPAAEPAEPPPAPPAENVGGSGATLPAGTP